MIVSVADTAAVRMPPVVLKVTALPFLTVWLVVPSVMLKSYDEPALVGSTQMNSPVVLS